ncbi:fungal-specific transcription factor domain-containing protein [Penicillium waksmanii]|uniref:fungal-specific transcription factor domain-containing protein n=1 Tax=Penicillium waksmanii TaxID=69791 RepID=UPI002548C4E6|nr:fungal-specific transcription factor domain-containing protein [Penicillium waksmanii]KAJ5963153.1 fungal-specific transcription factor domain-containing protein [Penicillium waksmanii]
MTTAFPGGAAISSPPERRLGRSALTIPWMQGSRSAIAELVGLLPSREVASLLVDTYFDRVHWFILIFHQDDFRRNWEEMYEFSAEDLIIKYPNPGFISTFLVVIAIALQYTGSHRQEILRNHSVCHSDLKEGILSTIRARLLDIVSLGSLEAVQTCVLLGTYYLYHGNPGLAWPVCGCGLRVAQALNLHRKLATDDADTRSPETQRLAETRKRCWWAIYEIETFCSMSYGYPHGIKDGDCDVELLDPLATSAGQSPATFDSTHQCPASLLSYKYLMSKLSVLIKDILTDLYRISHQGANQNDSLNSRSLQNLIRKVSRLDDRLRKWKKEIPATLNPSTNTANYTSVEEMDAEVGASGPRFEQHIYQLQALSLELAYENARILLHRPLIAYRVTPRAETETENQTPCRNPLHFSLSACRDAALHTSNLGESPIFLLAADTYAAAFIGIHTFTAGVMLCILTSIKPLSPQSHESKMGLRRLIKMQTHLKSRTESTLASQGLEILERLTRLVMEKELKEMLASNSVAQQTPQSTAQRIEPTGYGNMAQAPTQGQYQVAEFPESIQNEETFDFIQDPAMSQALLDFDQVLSGNDINIPLDPLFPDLAGPGNGFTQEQAWIWGMDNLQRFPGTE